MSILSTRMLGRNAFKKNVLGGKDYAKAMKADCFIGYGTKGSSTERYRLAAGDLANVNEYTKDLVVFVSINGKRSGAISVYSSLYTTQLNAAIKVGATFISDMAGTAFGCRDSSHNVGERELAIYLRANNYEDSEGLGIWSPISNL